MASNPPAENTAAVEQHASAGNGAATQPEANPATAPAPAPAPVPAMPESRLPTRKDISLKELLGKLEKDYAPIVIESTRHTAYPVSSPPPHLRRALLTTTTVPLLAPRRSPTP